MLTRTSAVVRKGIDLLVDKTSRATTLVALAFGLVWAPAAYACTHGQNFYTTCGGNWTTFFIDTEVCACNCVNGTLGTNCHVV